jgi:ankyrin repeat protein
LHIAAYKGNKETCVYLLENGANKDLKTKSSSFFSNGMTPSQLSSNSVKELFK